MAALKAAIGGDDVAAIRAKLEALQQSSMRLGEAMYKAQQDGSGGAAEGGAAGETPGGYAKGKGADDVVDADFEEVDDQDRNKSA